MAQPAQINIKIKCLKSDDFEVSIDSEASVDDLKEEIVRIKNIEPTRQRLIYKGRVLKSDKKLKDYKISDSTTIHLITRKQPVTNPRNDEPNETNRVNRNTSTIPAGTTAISVAVVDGSNGAADVNSILNSVLSGFSSGNLNQQSLQNQIQSAMNNNPAHVMNLRGLLNPGDNPNAVNDDDISSIDGDDNDNNNNNNNTTNRNNRRGNRNILPDLQPQFAVSNGRGGYSPVTLLPPVLRSCNAINLELDRLQRNYNRDALGIDVNNTDEKNQSNMSIDNTQNNNQMNVDRNDVEVEVQTIVADSNGNVLSNNITPVNQNQNQNHNQNAAAQNVGANTSANTNANVNANASAPQAQGQGQGQARGRREYLNNLLDTWERYDEVVNGVNPLDNIENGIDMDEDVLEMDNDEEMKGTNDIIGDYKGVIGYIESVFDELIDFQNSIESGLNNEIMEKEQKENKEEKKCDEDNDMEMTGNNDNDNDIDIQNNNNNNTNNNNDNDNVLKGYSKDDKDKLKKKVKGAGNMLIEIGTVLASLGHMIDKMNIHRNTTRNRLRITGLSGISHVVRTAVPVEISTIVSRGINMGNLPQQFQQMRQMRMAQQPNNNPPANANANANTDQNASNVQPPPPTQPQPQAQATVNSNIDQNATSTTTTTTTTTTMINGNANTDTNTTTSVNNDGSTNNLLSAVLDQFGNNSNDNDGNSMEVDENMNSNTNNNNNSVQNNNNNNNNNNVSGQAANPLGAMLSALGGSGGSNPLASLMSAAFGSATNRNRNNNNNSQNNNNNNNDRNPLMLINRSIKFLIDTLNISELNDIKLGNYKFIRNYHQILKSFILNTILSGNDTPMRRHEIAMDYASGFGLFMIYHKFSSETREVIRSLTTNHFRNNTPLLLDIILDSNSDVTFEEKLVTWIQNVFSAWIYKLSLKFQNRIKGVKILFGTILMNVIKYLYRNNNNILNKTQLIPKYVEYFVGMGKAYHLKTMAQVHGSEINENNINRNDNNKIKKKKIYGNEQWVMNVEESERNRWVDTIKCDQKRMKQCLNQMKGYKFSESYLIPSHENQKNKNDDKKDNKK